MPLQSEPPIPSRLLSEGAPPHWRADALSGVRHGFFGRKGGVSEGIYASLNAGVGSSDDADRVSRNRARIASAFGAPVEQFVGLHQVHSALAVIVDAPFKGARRQADALVTATPGLVLSILTADCTPVLLADPNSGVIGAAHAGWKGALGGVLDAVVGAMRACGAHHIIAAIGPCIHQASYEVGPEFEATFAGVDPEHARFFKAGAGDRRLFDLPGFCAAELERLGVAQIETLPLNTYAEEGALFSHRRSVHRAEGDYGRNCAAIALG